MGALVLAARLGLCAVFAVAGAAKLRDRAGTRLTLMDFGLPARLAGAVAVLLPLAELGTAGLLVPDATALAGGIGALALLGAFAVAISAAMARGERPDCNCFGQFGSEPIRAATLVRNVVLVALAALVVLGGRPHAAADALDVVAGLETATALAGAALAVALLGLAIQAWLTLHSLRQQGRILLRLDALDGGGAALGAAPQSASRPPGLPVGAPAPDFDLTTTIGGRVTIAQLIDPERALVLAFVDPDCRSCRTLVPELARRHAEIAAPRVALVMSRTESDAAAAMVAGHGSPLVALDADGSVAERYRVPGTPCAVAIGPDGLIHSELAAGPDAVAALLAALDRDGGDVGAGLPIVHVQAAGASNGGGEPQLGSLLPDLELEATAGPPTSLREAARGAPHLLVFWSPACGYCDAMLDDVRALEARDDLPPLLLIASGGADANREQGLRSRTLLDPDFAGTRSGLQVAGTPSAVRLDGEGRIVSQVAVGADSVLALAGAGEIQGTAIYGL